jgi:hypothetical protein
MRSAVSMIRVTGARPAAQPIAQQRREHDQQRDRFLLDRSKIIEGAVKRFGGNRGMNFERPSARCHALHRDAILQLIQIRGEESDLAFANGRQGNADLKKFPRLEDPILIFVGYFEEHAAGPPTREIGQFFVNFRSTLGSAFRE